MQQRALSPRSGCWQAEPSFRLLWSHGFLMQWFQTSPCQSPNQLQQCLPTLLTTGTSTAAVVTSWCFVPSMWGHLWHHAAQVRAGMLMSMRTQSDPDLGRLLHRQRDAAVAGDLLQPQRATEDTPFELRVLETALDVVSVGPACQCKLAPCSAHKDLGMHEVVSFLRSPQWQRPRRDGQACGQCLTGSLHCPSGLQPPFGDCGGAGEGRGTSAAQPNSPHGEQAAGQSIFSSYGCLWGTQCAAQTLSRSSCRRCCCSQVVC